MTSLLIALLRGLAPRSWILLLPATSTGVALIAAREQAAEQATALETHRRLRPFRSTVPWHDHRECRLRPFSDLSTSHQLRIRGGDMEYSVSASVFLAIIIVIRLARRTESRTRADERFTVLSSVVFGVLIAATPWGQGILKLVGIATQATH